MRKLRNLHLATILILFITPASLRGERTRWVSVQKIYAKGKHNAWPDMCRWRDKIYVVFPGHGAGHAETHGVVVLESDDDETWPAETLFFLPTEERLYLLYWTMAKGNTDVAAEKKQELKKRWMGQGGTKNSWQR